MWIVWEAVGWAQVWSRPSVDLCAMGVPETNRRGYRGPIRRPRLETSCDPCCYFKVVAFSYLIMNEIAFEDRS